MLEISGKFRIFGFIFRRCRCAGCQCEPEKTNPMRRICIFCLSLLGFAAGCEPESPDMYGPAPAEYEVKPQAEADGAAVDPAEGISAEQDVADESLPTEQG